MLHIGVRLVVEVDFPLLGVSSRDFDEAVHVASRDLLVIQLLEVEFGGQIVDDFLHFLLSVTVQTLRLEQVTVAHFEQRAVEN